MTKETSVAHKFEIPANHPSLINYTVHWRDAQEPNLAVGRTIGQLRSCDYCGSMHPADVAAAIRAGARGHWADFKYGWPHKAYFDDVPNPHAGMLESRMSASHAMPCCPKTGDLCVEHGKQSFTYPTCDCMKDGAVKKGERDGRKMIAIPDGYNSRTGKPAFEWAEEGKPAGPTTHGKFYTVHLQDATPEDRETIEKHLGLHFEFDDKGGASWKPAQ